MIRTNNNTYFKTDNRYRKASTSYIIGDIVYSRNLPNSYRLECVVSGTSDSVEPTYSGPVAGQYIQDGTCIWIIDDIHDSQKIGDITFSYILRPGYIQANGSLLSDASINYPRLILFLTDNPSLKAVDDTVWASNKALYIYDSVGDTLRVPDCTGRVLQGGNTIESVEAGLPNITGSIIAWAALTASGTAIPFYTSSETGAFKKGTTFHNGSKGANGSGATDFNPIELDASRSNSIYSASTTVQPPALALIPQIKY